MIEEQVTLVRGRVQHVRLSWCFMVPAFCLINGVSALSGSQ